jgi:autotransporter-associated beta strand protein
MKTKTNRPLPRRLSGLAYAVLAVLALAFTLTTARAADYYLTNSDAFGLSSFNTAGNWDPNVAPFSALPSDTNSYWMTNKNMRTPADTLPHIFAGDVLHLGDSSINTAQVIFQIKGSGLITVSNLVADGGNMPAGQASIIQNAGTGATPNTASIAGNIYVVTNVVMKSGGVGGTLAITALLQGTNIGNGQNILSFIDLGGTNLLSGNQPYTGSLFESGVQVVMDSTFSMTPSSLTVGQNAQVADLVTTTLIYNTTNTVLAGGNLNVGNGTPGTVLNVGLRAISSPQKTNDPVVGILDVSKQSSFTANVGTVSVGLQGAAGGTIAANSTSFGAILLATNNTIITTGANGIIIGNSTTSGNGASPTSWLTLGSGTNLIDTAALSCGGVKSRGSMYLTNGGLLILTNSAGGGVNWSLGKSTAFGSALSGGTNDLSGGTVIATVNSLILGLKTSNDGGQSVGELDLSTNAANLINANEIDLGRENSATANVTSTCTGIMNVNGGNVFVGTLVLGWWDYIGGRSFGILNLNGGNFVVTNSIDQNFSYSGTLNVNGGLLNMAGNGFITVSNIVVNSTITNASSIGVANLSGSGAIVGSGTTTVSRVFNPGTTITAGTLTANSVTFNPAATLNYKLGTTTTVGGGVNDLLVVNGDLDLGNATLNIALLGNSLTAGTYTLATFTGNIFNSLTLPITTRYTLTLATNTMTSPQQLNLIVSGSANSLVWNGVNSAAWDTTTQNWTNQLGNADYYFNLDAVRFDDTAFTTAVTLAGTVTPSSVTFSNNTTAYSLSGAGGISGSTGLTKQGTNSLTLSTTNSYTGATTLSAGTLNINNARAIGATASTLTISGVSTIANTTAAAITLANNNPQVWNADFTVGGTQGLNMGTGPVTLGGNRQVNVTNSAATLTAGGIISDGGNGYSITKLGAGTLTLGQFNTYSGGTIVSGGTLTFGQISGLGTGPVSVSNGASLFVGTQNIGNPITLAGGTIRSLSDLATFTANGGVNLTANSAFVIKFHDTTEIINIATTKMTGVGGFSLTDQNNGYAFAPGSPVLLFSVPCDYAGDTTLTSGTLRMNALNAMPFGAGKGNVILNGAANPTGTNVAGILDLNGFNTSINGLSGTANAVLGVVKNSSGTVATLTVGNGDATSIFSGAIINGTGALALVKTGAGTFTLAGANTYSGATTVSGGTLLVNGSIGASSTVTVLTTGTLGGTGTIGGAATYNTGSSAVLTLGSPLTFSSSLIVSNGANVHLVLSNNVPVGTNTLATYNVTGSSGTFASTPVIDSGSLAGGTTGTIVTSGGLVQLQVTAAASSTPPSFPPGGVSVLPGGGISLVATGAVGGTYSLWATTNLALTPVTNTWTLLTNGTITTSPFTNIDLTATNYPQRFYLFSTP